MVAIIDYGVGNLASVQKALEFLGRGAVITCDKEVILKSDKVILPGVGAFSEAMKRLEESKMDLVVKEVAREGIPLLGICLGMQLLFDESSEGGVITKGLGLIPGKVELFPEMGLKIPHMGWNSIMTNINSRLFKGIENNSYVYFVHSYFCKAVNESNVATTTQYGIIFDSAIESENIFATQFHPEKSGDVGLNILRNFVDI